MHTYEIVVHDIKTYTVEANTEAEARTVVIDNADKDLNVQRDEFAIDSVNKVS